MKTFCAVERAERKKNVRRKMAALSMVEARLEVVGWLMASCFQPIPYELQV